MKIKWFNHIEDNNTRDGENNHNFHVELTQQNIQTKSSQVNDFGSNLGLINDNITVTLKNLYI